jgi:hypothetical protein
MHACSGQAYTISEDLMLDQAVPLLLRAERLQSEIQNYILVFRYLNKAWEGCW